MTDTLKDIPFEEAMEQLEQLVKQLEQGNLPLDKALSAFQKGIQLSNYCQKQLKEADQMVVNLMTDQGKEAFDEEA